MVMFEGFLRSVIVVIRECTGSPCRTGSWEGVSSVEALLTN